MPTIRDQIRRPRLLAAVEAAIKHGGHVTLKDVGIGGIMMRGLIRAQIFREVDCQGDRGKTYALLVGCAREAERLIDEQMEREKQQLREKRRNRERLNLVGEKPQPTGTGGVVHYLENQRHWGWSGARAGGCLGSTLAGNSYVASRA